MDNVFEVSEVNDFNFSIKFTVHSLYMCLSEKV